MVTRIILTLGAALLLTACTGRGAGGEDGAVAVVAGFYPLAYVAERVGGGAVTVQNLTPPGAEPHDFELSPRDVEAVRSADLVLYLGRGFQPALEDAVEGLGGKAVDLLDGLPLRARDPHVWLDPVLLGRIAARVAAALGRPGAESGLVAELGALHSELAAGLATCERHEIVTSHEAFVYLAARYGLEQVSVSGLSPEVDPSPRDLEDVVDAVRRSGATTIFYEPLVSPRIAETVAREAGVETAVLDPLEGLDGERAGRGEDYLSVMRENLAALRQGLGCS